jgi:hypothetical protein
MGINEIIFDEDGGMTYGFAFRGFRSNGTMVGMTSWTFYFTVLPRLPGCRVPGRPNAHCP